MSGLESMSDSEVENDVHTLEDQVQEVMGQFPRQSQPSSSSGSLCVPIEPTVADKNEKDKQTEFFLKGCGCEKHCDILFSPQHVNEIRSSCLELNTSDLDSVILGQLSAFGSTRNCVGITTRHAPKERDRTRFFYHHQGEKICSNMFFFLHTIGGKRRRNLISHFLEHGILPRVHGNTGKIPHNTLSLHVTEFVVRFLLNYTEQNGLLLPGRVPGYSRSDIKLLPSSVSKRGIWKFYHSATATHEDTIRSVSYSTFCRTWRNLLPSIILMKPMSDLCWQCQQNSTAILRSANMPETEKSATLLKAEEHLRHVQTERSFYKSTCDMCKETVHTFFSDGTSFKLPPLASDIPENSNDIKAHFSFDFAQQIHYPSNPLQPGPIYFLTPRKCSIFGINCEAIPRQVNFLIDEAGDCGKGSNSVISMLHYFFSHHALGEMEVFLHADNCSGQNKNSNMLSYLSWRTITKRHTQVTLSFLVVGHTKFSPDWCFGLLKRKYRQTHVTTLSGISEVVNRSACCNFSQLVSLEDGTTVVPTFDWTSFFAPLFRKFVGIKKFHHFRFHSSSPGKVFVKEHADSAEQQFDILKLPWNLANHELPSVITPHGLSPDRQWYLYDHIRQFCPEGDRDLTCPRPSFPKASSRLSTPAPVDTEDEPPRKQLRCCGLCRQEGHNSRSCPSK